MADLALNAEMSFPLEVPDAPELCKTELKTGIEALDEITGHFLNGELIGVAGTKKYLSSSILISILSRAVSSDRITYFITDKMSEETAAELLLFKLCDIPYKEDKYDISAAEWEQLRFAYAKLLKSRISVISLPDISTDFLEILLEHTEDAGAVIIDSLDGMASLFPDFTDSRTAELDNITFNLKRIAKEFNVPIIVSFEISNRVCKYTNGELSEMNAVQLKCFEGFYDIIYTVSKEKGTVTYSIVKNWRGGCGKVIINQDK